MKKYYDIEINYQTGDSFKSYDTSDLLDIPMFDIEIAKINLKRIKEHYQYYQSLDRWYRGKTIIKPDFYIDKDHEYNKGKSYIEKFQNGLEILLDKENNTRVIYPFWIGYFETLHGARIIEISPDNSDENELSFTL